MERLLSTQESKASQPVSVLILMTALTLFPHDSKEGNTGYHRRLNKHSPSFSRTLQNIIKISLLILLLLTLHKHDIYIFTCS